MKISSSIVIESTPILLCATAVYYYIMYREYKFTYNARYTLSVSLSFSKRGF